MEKAANLVNLETPPTVQQYFLVVNKMVYPWEDLSLRDHAIKCFTMVI